MDLVIVGFYFAAILFTVTVMLAITAFLRDLDKYIARYKVNKRLGALKPVAALSGNCDFLLFSRYTIRVNEAVRANDFEHAHYLLNRLSKRIGYEM
ncbi:TMhelix containing protein [Vibrio phage 1.215.B._10N.222.54.F7]|nr:TMhelix containing protein [Vibrio phage 1.215.A._10N.222.54.F7]AUR96074.1 TMhelix containing protein [Vibrio phage 1.215.B._10N.222.54.F7]